MNATKYYVSTTRLVMGCDPYSPGTWQDLYTLLPTLRNSLSCTVCEHLLNEPYTPEETSCEHHVCKSCKGGVKKLKPTCSWCKDYSKYFENVQLRILIQNYKKLCGYVKITPMYGAVIKHKDHGQLLKDIIRESEGDKVIPMSIANMTASYSEAEIESEEENAGKVENIKEEQESFEEYPDTPIELVEEEIVGECSDSEFPGLGCRLTEELRGTDEPPDEIISSPFSKLKMAGETSSVGPSPLSDSVRISLVQSFGEDAPLYPQIKQEFGAPVTLEPAVKPNPVKNATKRKIKGEAFILDPVKAKAEFPPQYRKLNSKPKVITVFGT